MRRPAISPTRIDAKLAASLTQNRDRELLIRDTETKGFYIRASKTGRVTFGVAYSFNGRERRMNLGTYPELSVLAARNMAKAKRANVMHGLDPLSEREEARRKTAEWAAAPTIRDLSDLYFSDHVLARQPDGRPVRTPAGVTNEQRYWRDIERVLGGRTKLATVTRDEIIAMHRELSQRAPVNANRVVTSLRSALNLAVREGLLDQNPAQYVKLNPEVSRDRYLDMTEVARLKQALDEERDKITAVVIWLALITGARRGELLKAKWSDIDLETGIWIKPANTTKQRKRHRLPLSPSAVSALLEIRALSDDDEFVVPGGFETARTRLKRAWARVRKVAGIEDVRFHDLRHSHASILISNGFGLEVVGAALGHSQAQTTLRYAHLMDSTLRKAVTVLSELSGPPPKHLH